MGSTSEYTIQLRGNHDKFQTCRSSDLVPGGTYETSLYVYYAPHTYFRVMQMSSFVQQINHLCTSFFHCIIISLVNESTTFVSPDRWWYYPTTSVLAAWQLSRIFVIYRGDWLSIKCCENDSFQNCSCFSKIPFSISVENPMIFQCLISIPAGHWVRQIDGDLPCWFCLSALLSLVISMTGRSERSARVLRDGADVVRGATGNWFCVRICYVILISKFRANWDLGLCTTSGLAFGEPERSGDFRKKKCISTQEKSGFAIALRFSKRSSRSCAQT